jgi:hypothetical protein
VVLVGEFVRRKIGYVGSGSIVPGFTIFVDWVDKIPVGIGAKRKEDYCQWVLPQSATWRRVGIIARWNERKLVTVDTKRYTIQEYQEPAARIPLTRLAVIPIVFRIIGIRYDQYNLSVMNLGSVGVQ